MKEAILGEQFVLSHEHQFLQLSDLVPVGYRTHNLPGKKCNYRHWMAFMETSLDLSEQLEKKMIPYRLVIIVE